MIDPEFETNLEPEIIEELQIYSKQIGGKKRKTKKKKTKKRKTKKRKTKSNKKNTIKRISYNYFYKNPSYIHI